MSRETPRIGAPSGGLASATLLAALFSPLAAGCRSATPPVEPARQHSSEAPSRPSRVVAAGALSLRIPDGWERWKPKPRMRFTQFSLPMTHVKVEAVRLLFGLPADAGDSPWSPAEFVVYHFGQKGAGSVRTVVKGWIEQFALKRRGVAEDRTFTILTGPHGEGTYTLVDVSGTYYYNVGPTFRFEARMVPRMKMLAAVVPTADGPYYVKLTGPEKTVSAAAEVFRVAFGGSASSETRLDLDELR